MSVQVTYFLKANLNTTRMLVEYASDPQSYAGDERDTIAANGMKMLDQLENLRTWNDWDGHSPIDFLCTGSKRRPWFWRLLTAPFRWIAAFWNHVIRFRVPPAE